MKKDREQNSGLSNSFTDLMTSLAVIFILLLCASLYNAQSEGQASRISVLEELQIELKDFVKSGVEVQFDRKIPLVLDPCSGGSPRISDWQG